jgi:hypothetical protein
MHSFHHSRGRILFETACALTISASCLGAWMDLGAPAFLPAAAVSALYGLIHLFDMRGHRQAVAYAAPAVELDAQSQGDLLEYADTRAAEFAPEVTQPSVEMAEDAASAADAAVIEMEPTPEPRPKKRRSSRKAAPVAQVEPVQAVEPAEEEAPAPEIAAVEVAPLVELEPMEPPVPEEPEDHAPVTPLFEPEPFVRQQRAVFGRKAG